MERIGIPATYPRSTRTPLTTLTSERAAFQAEWFGIGCSPLFDCPQCAGAGFVHPRDLDGRIVYRRTIPCNHPGCYAEDFQAYRRGEIVQQSGIIGVHQTFASFRPTVPGVQKAYNAAWKIAEGEGDFIWLLIYGGMGNGKTHLLSAIANRVMERGTPVRLVMMAELLSGLRMAMDTHQVDFKMQELKEVPYLLIDELGLEYGTEWEKEKIEELLAARWAHGRFTVVATNRDIGDLPPRIKSRFQDKQFSRWVKNEAGDYRRSRT